MLIRGGTNTQQNQCLATTCLIINHLRIISPWCWEIVYPFIPNIFQQVDLKGHKHRQAISVGTVRGRCGIFMDYGKCGPGRRASDGKGLDRSRRPRREALRSPAEVCRWAGLQPHVGRPAPASRRRPAPRGGGRPAFRPLRPGARRPRRHPVHGRGARRARPAHRVFGPLVVRNRRRVASAGGPDAARTRRAGLRHPGRRRALLHLPGHHDALHGGGRAREARLLRARPAEPDRRAQRGRAGASSRLRELLRRARRGRATRHDGRRAGGPLPAGAETRPRARRWSRAAAGGAEMLPAGHPAAVGVPVAQHADAGDGARLPRDVPR